MRIWTENPNKADRINAENGKEKRNLNRSKEKEEQNMNEENMLLAELKEKQKQLHEIIPKVEKRLSSAPEGKLRIMKPGLLSPIRQSRLQQVIRNTMTFQDFVCVPNQKL